MSKKRNFIILTILLAFVLIILTHKVSFGVEEKPCTNCDWDGVLSATVDKEATCTQEGKKTWKCNKCAYKEEETIPKQGHIYTSTSHHARVEPTCTTEGSKEYWFCSRCNKNYSESTQTNKYTEKVITDITIPAKGHSLEKIQEIEPTCTKDGNIKYYECNDCGKMWRDAKMTDEIKLSDTRLSATGHSTTKTHVAAKVATCKENGNKEYWKCTNTGCTACFESASSTVVCELSYFIIPKSEHDYKRTPNRSRLVCLG